MLAARWIVCLPVREAASLSGIITIVVIIILIIISSNSNTSNNVLPFTIITDSSSDSRVGGLVSGFSLGDLYILTLASCNSEFHSPNRPGFCIRLRRVAEVTRSWGLVQSFVWEII